MKFFSVLYVFAILAGVAVHARVDYDELEAREFADELSARELVLNFHARSEMISEISTRDLVAELEDRLQRRGHSESKPSTYMCPYCSSKYTTAQEAKDCSLFCKAK